MDEATSGFSVSDRSSPFLEAGEGGRVIVYELLGPLHCFPLVSWSRATRAICSKWTGKAEFQSEYECQGLSPCHQGVILFLFCPHLFKNKVVCSPLVASWIWPVVWPLLSPSPRGQRLWKNPKVLLFVLAYKVIVRACVGGVGCSSVMQCLEGLRIADRSQCSPTTGILSIELRLLGVGTTSLYPLNNLAIPLFKMCYVYAGLCICRVHVCEWWNPEDSPSIVFSSNILGTALKSLCSGGVPLPTCPFTNQAVRSTAWTSVTLAFSEVTCSSFSRGAKCVANRSSWIFILG